LYWFKKSFGQLIMKYDITAIAFSKASTDARLLNLINTLKDSGKKILVIALRDEVFEEYAQSCGIEFFGLESNKNQRLMKRWNEFLKLGRKIIRGNESEFILASDLYALPLAARMKKKSGGKLFYDSREIYSALGSLSNNAAKQKFQNMIEKYYVSSVDEMIVSGEMDAEYLTKYFAHSLPYHIIMNLPPKTQVERTNFLREHFALPPETRIVLYQGALMGGRGIEQLIDAIQLVQNSVLVIVGAGPNEQIFRNEVYKLGLDSKILFFGEVPYEQLPRITASADLGTALFQAISLSYQLALPNKLFEYFMAGVPVLASDLPAMRKVYEEFNFGSLVPNDISIGELAEEITALLEKRAQYTEALKAASEKYNYDNEIKKIRSIFGVE
jgi:glycosyltransferase involved in cell wall biosynthesis